MFPGNCYRSLLAGLFLAFSAYTWADDQPDAKPIMDKAIKAMGGEERLARLTAAGTAKGKFTLERGGKTENTTVDVSWQGLGKYRADVDEDLNGMSVKFLLVLNGDKSWINFKGSTQEVPRKSQPFHLIYALRGPSMLPSLRGKEFKLSPLGEVKIDDKSAVGLLVSHKGDQDLRLFFDKDRGLPLKVEMHLDVIQGQNRTLEFHYENYKDFGGLRLPAKVKIKVDNKEIAVEVSEIKSEDKLDDGLFAKP